MSIKKLLDDEMLPWTHEMHDDGRRAIAASDDSGVYLHGSAWSVTDDDLRLIVSSVNAMPKMLALLEQAECPELVCIDGQIPIGQQDGKMQFKHCQWCAEVAALAGEK